MPLNGNSEPPVALVDATSKLCRTGPSMIERVSRRRLRPRHRNRVPGIASFDSFGKRRGLDAQGSPYPFGVNCRANGSLVRPELRAAP